jgi:hypothetical protein
MAAGDHLQVPRQHGLFHHHGIDLGDGTVAHYLEGREILRSTCQDFSQGQPLTVIQHSESSPTGVTVRRAMSRIGEQNYNLLFNNCEHFATWCKTGRHRSGQIESAVERARQWSNIMPSALISGLKLLVDKGLIDDNARALAQQGLEQLERLRQTLLRKLETMLNSSSSKRSGPWQLTGQSLADQLEDVEDLKRQIDALLRLPETTGQNDHQT